MADRFDLIARKEVVRRQIEQVRHQWACEQAQLPAVKQRRLDQLATQLERLMAEE